MKSQLPIIIAMIILTGLILASMFYSVTVTTYISEMNRGSLKTNWDLIDEELDTLSLVALKYASNYAYENFSTTFATLFYNPTYEVDLIKRNALYYTDFEDSPDQDFIFLTGNWYWDPYNHLLIGEKGGDFDYAIALIDMDLKNIFSNSNIVYLAFIGNTDAHIDWIMYGVSWFYWKMFLSGYDELRSRLVIIDYSLRTQYILNSTKIRFEPFLYVGSYNYRQTNRITYENKINLTVYNYNYTERNIQFVYDDYYILPDYYFGFYYGIGGYDRIEIQKLILVSSVDPRYVYFTNIPVNWKVEITNGTVSYTGIADTSGNVRLFFPELIWRNATIIIYNDQNNKVYEGTFDLIVGGDQFKLNEVSRFSNLEDYDYYEDLGMFINSIKNASNAALRVFREKTLKIINNWIYYKVREGYVIKIENFDPFYNVTLWTDENYVSHGRGSIGFNIKYNIISPTGEYMEFNKSINATYKVSFSLGYPYGFENMTLPINFTAILKINNKVYYYMLSRKELKITIYSILFRELEIFRISSNGNYYVSLVPEGVLYLKNGVMESYYKLKYGTGSTGIAAMDLYYDVVNVLVPVFGNKYYFLWATITVANIDGVKVPSALKIVMIYNYYPRYNILQVRIYGDENRPITPIT